MTRPQIATFPNLESLSQGAAEFICRLALKIIKKKGVFTLVLSGGVTPRRLYEILSLPPFLKKIPWERIHFFWGDERCVLPDQPESNYNLIFRTLLSHIPVPAGNIHPIPVGKGPGLVVAREYEEIVYRFSTVGNTSDFLEGLKPIPSFDLILLGLGKDGHTASLFPGDPALKETEHLTAYVPRSPLSPFLPRITMTLPVINQAECVLFLVSGPDKNKMVKSILNHPESSRNQFPAALVVPKGKVYWYLTFRHSEIFY